MQISKTPPKRTQSYRMSEPAILIIKDLAEAYDTSQADIVNTLVTTAGNKILLKFERDQRAAEQT
jgi:hypothetical protein